MATRRRDDTGGLHKGRHGDDVVAPFPKAGPNGAILEFERVLSQAKQDLRDLLQSDELCSQREAVLNTGSAVAVQALVKQGEKRLELIQKNLGDKIRQAEMLMGKMAVRINEFNIQARILWPRLKIVAKIEVSTDKNRCNVRVKAKVKGEGYFCVDHSELYGEFPSVELQAQLGLVG